MRRTHFIQHIALCVLVLAVAPSVARAAELIVTQSVGETTLQLNNDPPFYSAARAVRSARVIPVESSTTLLAVWEEIDDRAVVIPMYAVFLDGKTPDQITETNYTIQLRYQRFDPLVGEPALDDSLRAPLDGNLFIVQFHVQLLPEFDAPLTANGAKLLRFMPYNAVIARIDPKDVPRVSVRSFER